jgi:hypothetical protein
VVVVHRFDCTTYYVTKHKNVQVEKIGKNQKTSSISRAGRLKKLIKRITVYNIVTLFSKVRFPVGSQELTFAIVEIPMTTLKVALLKFKIMVFPRILILTL